jgi:hypothetical protein
MAAAEGVRKGLGHEFSRIFHKFDGKILTTKPMIGSRQPKLGLPRDTDKKRITWDVSAIG